MVAGYRGAMMHCRAGGRTGQTCSHSYARSPLTPGGPLKSLLGPLSHPPSRISPSPLAPPHGPPHHSRWARIDLTRQLEPLPHTITLALVAPPARIVEPRKRVPVLGVRAPARPPTRIGPVLDRHERALRVPDWAVRVGLVDELEYVEGLSERFSLCGLTRSQSSRTDIGEYVRARRRPQAVAASGRVGDGSTADLGHVLPSDRAVREEVDQRVPSHREQQSRPPLTPREGLLMHDCVLGGSAEFKEE